MARQQIGSPAKATGEDCTARPVRRTAEQGFVRPRGRHAGEG
jgi:hypothetical protein